MKYHPPQRSHFAGQHHHRNQVKRLFKSSEFTILMHCLQIRHVENGGQVKHWIDIEYNVPAQQIVQPVVVQQAPVQPMYVVPAHGPMIVPMTPSKGQ